MSENGPRKLLPPLVLLPEFLKALLARGFRPFRVVWRRSWLYRRLLTGKMPDRVIYYPYDAMPRRLEDADALLRGRFRFAGDTVEVAEGSVFDKRPPSTSWSLALQEFDWLPPLAAAGGDPARRLATNLMTQWVRRFSRYREPAWAPHVMGRRLINIFAHGRLVLSNSDMLWRSKLFVSLREQCRQLARNVDEAPEGLPRFEAAAALALSGICLDDSDKRLGAGIARLETQLARQILPDGGHASRSPEALLDCYRHVVMVMDALSAVGYRIPQTIISAHDRMAPMIRFFRHGDGALALFNGGKEGSARTIAGLLARDEVRGQPFVFAPHSAYQRLVAGRSLALMDVGLTPEGRFSNDAHAGCLAFEFSAAGQRIVVNCGSASGGQIKWNGALRATAAHSTVTIADTSMASILPRGLARDLLGPRLLGGPTKVETSRQETPSGWRVDARHDGYLRHFGVEHARALTLSPTGNLLMGVDTITPKERTRREGLPFAVRFHIHPDLRCSIAQGGDVLLKMPTGEGWRFHASTGPVGIEESIYLGGDTVRRSEQIVITGAVRDQPVSLSWAFEQVTHS
ncbi:MAG TPA: heparinase II/III family protein [Rhizomicrobium sp.]|nr:heparinase II/III family protein [Rhizomicrobium sp.]